MNVREQERGNVLVLSIDEKRLDAHKAPRLREEIISRIDQGRHLIVIDLAATEFMDSSGLGALVSCLKRLGPQGGIAVASIGSSVSRLFSLTRMNRVFSLHDSVDEAVAQLES
ncbi:STAS domain-containing protein [Paracoccus tibetensis]|uniref:Anti-sigma factor antagonist n=1 Tax=Paracoccus tibetensis TaxID=336292 RepID=A0A1G5JKN2_9RHOB|nr:STAS domain-containing protein [Paracoccus tibetensis]SCY88877.1 anti-sigma B factor antagonist [Paracoccus tibetensis]